MDKLIGTEDQKQLKEFFEKEFKDDIDVHLYIGEKPNELASLTKQLLEELSELDSRIKLNVYNTPESPEPLIPMYPTIWIGKDLGHKILFWGAPYQHEFNSLIETLMLVSQRTTDLPENHKKSISELQKDVKIHIFVTPTCPYCPRSVIIGHKIALESKGKVTSICVEAQENPELSTRFNVSSVPQQVINEDIESISVGISDLNTFIEQILSYGRGEPESIIEARKETPDSELLLLKPEEIMDVLEKHQKVVAIFTGDECQNCEGVKEILKGMLSEVGDSLKIIEVDLGSKREIPGFKPFPMIPTIISFEKSEEKGRWMGSLPPPVLKAKVKKFSEKDK